MSLLGKRKDELSNRIVTTSPDVTVSTNLSGWVNLKGVFKGEKHSDIFHEKKVLSPIKWEKSPQGQHIELGIAENNLFLLLAAMGLSEQLFKERLIPIGTIYDTFIARGLDALNYACYQDARFILIGTPSGITLGPEGGAHQSIGTPLIGLSQDGLATFEPAFCDELEAIFDWSFNYIQRDGKGRSEFEWLRDKRGGSVYLRLSTRSIEQPKRIFTKDLRENILKGGYWLKEPNKGSELAIIFTGVIAPEALLAWEIISKELSGVGLLCVTSADRLNAGWTAAQRARQLGQLNVESHIEVLLSVLSRQGVLVTVTDSFPTILSWIGGVRGQRTESLGVEEFGQSGNLKELYESYRIDSKAIIQACQAVRRSRVRLKIKE
jgi:pyruvate dehydrogenase E1 component